MSVAHRACARWLLWRFIEHGQPGIHTPGFTDEQGNSDSHPFFTND
jgi:hypothetical protein